MSLEVLPFLFGVGVGWLCKVLWDFYGPLKKD